jgi:hypothetical protein
MIHSDLSPRLDTDSQAQMLELTLPILAIYSPYSTRCKDTSIPTISNYIITIIAKVGPDFVKAIKTASCQT